VASVYRRDMGKSSEVGEVLEAALGARTFAEMDRGPLEVLACKCPSRTGLEVAFEGVGLLPIRKCHIRLE